MNSIGIDLGTTNSVASYTHLGQPIVISNRDGERLTPSVVSYRSGDYLVGVQAVHYARQAPRDTVYSTKRLMGLNFEDSRVQELRRRTPFEIVAAGDGDRAARVVVNGKAHTPVEIATLLLRQIKEDCAQRLSRPIEGATITVPAYFADCQKNATREAGEKAGLHLRPLLNEPVAAALAFVLNETSRVHRLLVYDLGGGTFDVSIVQIAGEVSSRPDEKHIQVLELGGDMWLGGDDFDEVIADRIYRWLDERYHFDARTDVAMRRHVKTMAEAAKVRLSDHDSVDICEPFLVHHPEKGPISVNLTLTRAEFEAGISHLVARSMRIVDEVKAKANLSDDKLTAVILAGGSTRVPLVRRSLEQRFGIAKVRRDVDPMHCVSLGAALWNDRFPMDVSGGISLSRLDQTGMPTPMHLGVEIYRDRNPHTFEIIVPAGTVYPTRETFRKTFRPTADQQRLLRVPIFQGTNSLTTVNEYQGVIEAELPRGLPSNAPIEIGFQIDLHGILAVEVAIPSINYQMKTRIERNQIARTSEEEERTRLWKDHLTNTMAAAERFDTDYGKYLTPADRQKIAELIRQAGDALKAGDPQAGIDQQKALYFAVVGTGAPGILFRAARAQEVAGGELAAQIDRLRKALERECASNRDAAEIDKLRKGLEILVKRAYGERAEREIGPAQGAVTY